MNVITAYLTRQVAAAGNSQKFKNNHLQKLKTAVTTGDLDAFIATLHVIYVPDGETQYIRSDGDELHLYNPYTTERYAEGWYTAQSDVRRYYKGASAVVDGSRGLKACLYHEEDVRGVGRIYTKDDGIGATLMYLNLNGNPDYHGRPTTALNWYTEEWSETSYSGLTTNFYPTTVMCTIPIFRSYESAAQYMSLVNTYYNSKDDDDLDNISDFMDSDMYDYDYETE